MKIFQWRNAKELDADTNPEISATTYKIGWQIYSKDGSIMTRTYEDVPEASRTSTYDSVKSEVDSMYQILESAAKSDSEFVNLVGNIFRLDDVIKVCILNNKQ